MLATPSRYYHVTAFKRVPSAARAADASRFRPRRTRTSLTNRAVRDDRNGRFITKQRIQYARYLDDARIFLMTIRFVEQTTRAYGLGRRRWRRTRRPAEESA